MRVINVVTIRNGVVDEIKSFGIFEEQLSEEVIEKAEDEFIQEAKRVGWNPEKHYCDNEQDLIEEGYYMTEYGDFPNVCLTWSEI